VKLPVSKGKNVSISQARFLAREKDILARILTMAPSYDSCSVLRELIENLHRAVFGYPHNRMHRRHGLVIDDKAIAGSLPFRSDQQSSLSQFDKCSKRIIVVGNEKSDQL
jgi:hypothetical protein